MKFRHLLLTLGLITCVAVSATAVQSHRQPSAFPDAMTVKELSEMGPRTFSERTGIKLGFKDRLAYRIAQKQVKKGLRKGTLQADDSAADVAKKASREINVGALLLGLFLGLIGLLIVLLAFRDRNAWKSALLGWGIWILLVIFLIAV